MKPRGHMVTRARLVEIIFSSKFGFCVLRSQYPLTYYIAKCLSINIRREQKIFIYFNLVRKYSKHLGGQLALAFWANASANDKKYAYHERVDTNDSPPFSFKWDA